MAEKKVSKRRTVSQPTKRSQRSSPIVSKTKKSAKGDVGVKREAKIVDNRKEVKMSDQVQCPNCGGYKLTSQKTTIQQKVPLSGSERTKAKTLGFLACLFFIVIGAPIIGASTESNICGLAAALLGLIGLWQSLFGNPIKTVVVGNKHDFTCLLCGYRWEWQEGQPWPKVYVNPDLIAKGAQKLEEEEEAERRRQEEAALHYLSRQGKK